MSTGARRGPEGDGGIPDELLRAGVYVPESRPSLKEVVIGSATGTEGADGLLSALSRRPDLLDEAVRGMSEMTAARGAESVLPVKPGDLLLAAPLARECGVPLCGTGIRPADAEGSAGEDPGLTVSIPDGERVVAVTAIHDRRAWSRTARLVRRAGGEAAGCLCLFAGDGRDAESVSGLVDPTRDTRSTDHVKE